MGIIRILIGLLLVMLPITQNRGMGTSAPYSDGLQQSKVAASEGKENFFLESALLEIQEKATGIASDDRGSDDFTSLLKPFFNALYFLNLPGLNGSPIPTGHSLAVVVSIPRYILYHCLIIPF